MLCYKKRSSFKSRYGGAMQAAYDMYFKVVTFKLLGCQPEPVEGGLILIPRVRQAHPDILLGIEPMSFAKSLIFFMSASP